MSLTVTPAPLTITTAAAEKVYGDPNPEFAVTFEGFVGGDTEACLSGIPGFVTAANSTSNAGAYNVLPSGLWNPNYNLTYTTGTLTIRKAVLTVTAADASRVFGAANPVFTSSYSGFVGNDGREMLNTPPNVSCEANALSPVGTYPLVPSGGVDDNYTFLYLNGTLEIAKAPAVVTLTGLTQAYDGSPKQVVVTTEPPGLNVIVTYDGGGARRPSRSASTR